MSEPLHVHRPQPQISPPFTRVGIVGVGLIGGSIALAIKRRWPDSLVVGVDVKEVIGRATVAHAIDVGADDLGMVSDTDLIVLAAPVGANERLLIDLQRLVTREVTITDVGSTKSGIAAAARRLPSHLTFIGGHPIAGAAGGGLQRARADLFDGQPWILCASAGRDLLPVRDWVSGLGAKPVAMDAAEHDRVMAFLSHLPQLTVSALMHVVGEHAGESRLPLAGLGLRDSTRLANSPVDIWKDVTRSNAGEIGQALDALIAVLQELRTDLERGAVLERIFHSAHDWKSRLDPP